MPEHRKPRFYWLAALLSINLLMTSVAQAGMVLNLRDASIRTLVQTIAEITGKNFVIDPRVKGKVTVISSRKMSAKDLYQVFLSILQVHGFAAVPAGAVRQLQPDVQAKPSGAPFMRGKGDELVTQVIAVKNVPAAQMVPVLRPLVPQQGHLAAYAPANVLIITDRAANIGRLLSIIARVDRAGSDELEVIPLQHASATEMARILTSLNQRTAKQAPNTRSLRLVADERTNSILMSGDLSARLRLRGIIAHLDTPLDSGGNTRVFYLKYAKAKELVAVLNGIGSSLTAGAKGAQKDKVSNISIQADESANALVITAPQDVLKTMKLVTAKLDVRRAQVAVEAIIAEISENRLAELGIQFNAGSGLESLNGVVGITNFSGNSLTNTSLTNPLGVRGGLTVGLLDGTFTLPGTDTQILNIKALARALNSDTDSNVLSTPTLVTLDNEEAEIVVGQNVPFLTGQFTNTGANNGATNPFQTIQRQDVGVTLKVKPQINEGDAIKLEIEQEVSSIAPVASVAGITSDIVTNKRSIKTSVLVDDGQILVLGGLISDRSNESVDKVPVLGDLPVIGALFRFNSSTNEKQNLMVFIRPTIIRNLQDGNAISSEKYNYMRARQISARERGVALMPNESRPTLPEVPGLPGPLKGSGPPDDE